MQSAHLVCQRWRGGSFGNFCCVRVIGCGLGLDLQCHTSTQSDNRLILLPGHPVEAGLLPSCTLGDAGDAPSHAEQLARGARYQQLRSWTVQKDIVCGDLRWGLPSRLRGSGFCRRRTLCSRRACCSGLPSLPLAFANHHLKPILRSHEHPFALAKWHVLGHSSWLRMSDFSSTWQSGPLYSSGTVCLGWWHEDRPYGMALSP